jgi:hypothetical protein
MWAESRPEVEMIFMVIFVFQSCVLQSLEWHARRLAGRAGRGVLAWSS